jgi:hypothetical protein
VFYANIKGLNDVICFKDMASDIINAKWYEDRHADLDDESRRVVSAAAKLIKDDIRRQSYSTDFYPDTGDVGDAAKGRSWLPVLLQHFMQELVTDEVKQVTIGHCIVQSSKPRSCISPGLLGLGVQVDLKFRSKWLINHLSTLGFSATYDKLLRYKQSVLQANQDGPVLLDYPGSFTRWVADNVDHNLTTLDGVG